MTAPLIVELLAFSSCDQSEGLPPDPGPIKFRYDGSHGGRFYVQTPHHDLPNALRSLADALEAEGTQALLELVEVDPVVGTKAHAPNYDATLGSEQVPGHQVGVVLGGGDDDLIPRF